ncbi:methyltransferase domain-containing protein [uncultured Nitrosomonas sp.]|uniref:class I SAM-dependent methyltransferase n=1 Tax=uncultured Nitrosomonas sp. TaxID=156424 RepID=UPI0025D67445|nr:methyltransferase domain-containing protein [uncultured Nitrosomonas sp.]
MMIEQNARQWFESSLGQYLIEHERRYFDQLMANIFGYNAVQIGWPQFDFLRLNRMPLRFSVGPEREVSLRAEAGFLPIQTNSMDLVILPHTLEFNANPHQILREVHRILIPEGHLVISGFNPFSLWGGCHHLKSMRGEFPWNGDFIALSRLKDWLKLLDFEMAGGRLCCYAPPFKQEKWRRRFGFMEAAGDRWWPISGGVYFLHAIKHTHGMRIIKPNWKNSLEAKKKMVPIAREIIKASKEERSSSNSRQIDDLNKS